MYPNESRQTLRSVNELVKVGNYWPLRLHCEYPEKKRVRKILNEVHRKPKLTIREVATVRSFRTHVCSSIVITTA